MALNGPEHLSSYPFDGFLNVLKAPGETSHAVVGWIRRLVGSQRVGHTGTLDPAAVGVLPIAVGVATRLAMAPGWDPKVYWGDVRFGVATTTDDAEGAVVAEADPTGLDLGSIEAVLDGFLGEVYQRPPAYSAVHVEGSRAYDLARSGVAPAPAPRKVRIDAISVVGWESPVLSLVIQCGSGTYIRALARDLGEEVGCPAHLAALVRLRVGPFTIGDALRYEELEMIASEGAWHTVLWPVDTPLGGQRAIAVGEANAQDFLHGRSWRASAEAEGDVRIFGPAGQFLGVASRRDAFVQPRVVLGETR